VGGMVVQADGVVDGGDGKACAEDGSKDEPCAENVWTSLHLRAALLALFVLFGQF
jgi:hypothetical protein